MHKLTNEIVAKVVVSEVVIEGAENRQQDHVHVVERGGPACDRPLHVTEPLLHQILHNLWDIKPQINLAKLTT